MILVTPKQAEICEWAIDSMKDLVADRIQHGELIDYTEDETPRIQAHWFEFINQPIPALVDFLYRVDVQFRNMAQQQDDGETYTRSLNAIVGIFEKYHPEAHKQYLEYKAWVSPQGINSNEE